jgi:methionine biosynthesis protein MetW
LREPKQVLEQLVRIARHAVVSVPNFGYWKNRGYLLFRGRMPMTKSLSYTWYETPNIHFCTITDFVQLCETLNLTIEQRTYVTEQGAPALLGNYQWLANWWCEQGVFMVRG